jgi:hypothetical protein
MKLASAVLAAVSLVASSGAFAVNLSPQGTGQVLLFPYYTVNANQDTYFSVSNQGGFPQVLKVRFNEGRNGRPVLDVDVVLKPHDAWTAAISVDAGGGAKLVTTDDSCTRPAIPAGGIAFTASGYDGSSTIPADDGPHDISRTREGSIEVIGGANISAPGSSPSPLPIDCGTIFDILPTSAAVLTAPGKLFGWAAIIDVGAGHYYQYNPTAIDEFTQVSLYSADWGPLKPTLNDANGAESGTRASAHFFLQANSIPTVGVPQEGVYDNGVDAITALLMADTIENDFIIDPALGASTDWVVTFPTKRFYVDPVYPDTNDPFAPAYLTCCAAFIYDRSGAVQAGYAGSSLALIYDTNVISFQPGGSTSAVFGSTLDFNVAPAAIDGTMRLEAPGDHSQPGIGEARGLPFQAGWLYGAPVIGFMAYNIVNANAQPGLLANYGAVSQHRRTNCGTGAYINSFICQW